MDDYDVVENKCQENATPLDLHNCDTLSQGYLGSEGGDSSSSTECNSSMRYMSLSEYIGAEFSRGHIPCENQATYNLKRERVYTFVRTPIKCEEFMFYGFLQCLDTFLFIFTYLPVRAIYTLSRILLKPFDLRNRSISASQKNDLVKMIVIIAGCIMMHQLDVSKIYHIIRGQAIIKLYIFYNMLEVADRLFSSFGQDILDALMWTIADSRGRRNSLFVLHLVAAVIYVFFHAALVLLQATTLNVAFNSHNKALLTIMMSNNFVELKGSVFKKFEKTNLFQMSCSDVRERFHLNILYFIVCVRNMTNFNWDLSHLFDLIPDIGLLLCSEVIVDSLKHAFITKFNNIPATVYRDFSVMIADDIISAKRTNSLTDISDQVSRRMGFTPLPLACLVIRIVSQSVKISTVMSWINVLLAVLCLFLLKVTISIIVLGLAVNCREVYVKDALVEQQDGYPQPDFDTKSSLNVKLKDIGFNEELLNCENNYHLKTSYKVKAHKK